MKPFLPYNILLIIAVAATVSVVVFNLTLRETFGVSIAYHYPQVSSAQAEEPLQPQQAQDQQEHSFLYDDYWEEEVVLASFPLELNRATYFELLYIPQVGEVTAQRIIQYREVLGGYSSLEQLMEINGIGEKTFETISVYLYLEEHSGEEE